MVLGTIPSIALSEKRARVSIVRLNPDTDEREPFAFVFPYFPGSFTDSYAANYEAQSPLGSSIPTQSWTHGNERSISFTSQLSTDVDLTQGRRDVEASDTNLALYDSLKLAGISDRSMDLRAAMAFLRSCTLPQYDPRFDRPKPPPKLYLSIPGSRIGIIGGSSQTGAGDDEILCVLKESPFTVKGVFPNGNPRLIEVSLTFIQIAQFKGRVAFPGITPTLNSYLTGATPSIAGMGRPPMKRTKTR